MDNEMYCILCHGRGLDNKDCTCKRCKGSGYEPDEYEIGWWPNGCQYRYARPGGPTTGHSRLLSNQVEGPTPSPGTTRQVNAG